MFRGRRSNPKEPGSGRIAQIGLALAILTALGLGVDVYYTHFNVSESFDVAIVEYDLAPKAGKYVQPDFYVDLALINRGSVPVRYIRTILHLSIPMDEFSSFPRESESDIRRLVEPGRIEGVELVYPALERDVVVMAYRECGRDTSDLKMSASLEVTVLDSKGRLLSGEMRIGELQYFTRGTAWQPLESDVLELSVLPGGSPARRRKGSAVLWSSAGISFDEDGAIRSIDFKPDKAVADSTESVR